VRLPHPPLVDSDTQVWGQSDWSSLHMTKVMGNETLNAAGKYMVLEDSMLISG